MILSVTVLEISKSTTQAVLRDQESVVSSLLLLLLLFRDTSPL